MSMWSFAGPNESCRGVEELARYCTCPVINGLTDLAHPCQALADLFTLDEIHGPLEGKRLAYIGDANNVARSLAVACGKLGVEFAIASPPKYQFDRPFLEQLTIAAPECVLLQTADPREAVRGRNRRLYRRLDQHGPGSRGRPSAERRLPRLSGECSADGSRRPKARSFMHCLPAHRGEEVTDEVIDGHYSAVLVQASQPDARAEGAVGVAAARDEGISRRVSRLYRCP